LGRKEVFEDLQSTIWRSPRLRQAASAAPSI